MRKVDKNLTQQLIKVNTDPNLAVSDTATDITPTKPRKWTDSGIPTTQRLFLGEAKVRALLDHKDTMTQTLKVNVNAGRDIEVNKIFERNGDKGIRTRIVILRDAESQKILSIGLIKIDLDNLGDKFTRDLDGTYKPFGELIKQHKVPVTGEVHKFYRMSTPQQKREKFFFFEK